MTVGVDLETYWTETPKQFEKHVEVYIEREKQRAKEMDVNNYNLGRYIAIAVNDPKKYPKKPFLADKDLNVERKDMTSEEMERVVKRNNIILGGKVKHGNIRHN